MSESIIYSLYGDKGPHDEGVTKQLTKTKDKRCSTMCCRYDRLGRN